MTDPDPPPECFRGRVPVRCLRCDRWVRRPAGSLTPGVGVLCANCKRHLEAAAALRWLAAFGPAHVPGRPPDLESRIARYAARAARGQDLFAAGG